MPLWHALPRLQTRGGRYQVSDLITYDDTFAGKRPAFALSPSGDGKELYASVALFIISEALCVTYTVKPYLAISTFTNFPLI